LLEQNVKNTVFKRYNTAVVIAFLVIVFIALAAASLRYVNELSSHKRHGLNLLKSQAQQLNGLLTQGEQAITGIKEFSEHLLTYPKELNPSLLPLIQDGERFYSETPHVDMFEQRNILSGSVTGFGRFSDFSTAKSEEIAMANMLIPAFITAQRMVEEITWSYYISFERFVYVFPWIDRSNWHYSDEILLEPDLQKMRQGTSANNPVIWSSPYMDSAGKGMMASMGIGVYREQQLLGAVIIDLNLAKLQQHLPELDTPEQGMVLFNQHNEILLFKQQAKSPLTHPTSWQEVLPKALTELTSQTLMKMDDSVQVGDWVIEKQRLAINGWVLLKYQPYNQFIANIRSHFIYMFTILLVGLLAFLMLVNTMTRRSFIKPTRQFIRHIEYCAQGDPGKVKASGDWLHWFMLVEDIFTQNRSLLLQLKEQNEVLDSRVLDKTYALQESSAKHQRDYVLLRSVMNAIPELIIFNDPQGQLMGCNQAFERITGKSEVAMFGQQASKFMPNSLAKEVTNSTLSFNGCYPQQQLLEAGEHSYQGFFNSFANEEGEVLGTITILQEVTEQQAIQSALEKAKNQAEYANQIKIQFLANMSHEIRTPINAMQGMMGLLDNTGLTSSQQHYLANAQSAAFSLLHLIDELLDLSKIEAGKMHIVKEVVNLPNAIDKALKLNLASIESKQLPLRVELSPHVPSYIKSDEMRLIQVLSNLLNNAIKFTSQGEVAIHVDTIGISDTNALVRFKVTDTGIGIAKDKQNHLFDAFAQADISMTRKYGGSGLGLSICQQIVRLLGGEITLSSDLGQGCELSFILPFSIPYTEATQYDEMLAQAGTVTICTLKQHLSVTCVDTIKSFGWRYIQVQDISELSELSELCQPNNADKVKGNLVLLSNETELNSQMQQAQHNNIDWQQQVSLIGLCQPAIVGLHSDICDQLLAMKLPCLLLDLPLYRFSLEQIIAALINDADLLNNSELENRDEVSERNLPSDLSLPTSAAEKNRPTSNELNGIKILLVEDNLVNQLVAKELLLSMQANVTIAENGKQAITLLAEYPFDVVLMDIQMPEMDGLTATTIIRKQEQESLAQPLPIIAMTAHAREEDKQRSFTAGMNLHIAKPVTGKVLRDSILQVLKLSS